MATQQQVNAVRQIVAAFLDTVRESGSNGAPAGVMYAAAMGMMTLNQFDQIMEALVATGKVRKSGNVYYAN